MEHVVDQARVAHLVPGPAAGEEVGGVAHALHAPGDDDLRFAEADLGGAEGDGGEAAAADLVDGEGGDGGGEAGADRRLAGGGHAQAGGEDAAQDDVLHRLRGHPGPLHGGPHGDGPQVGGAEGGQGAEELPHRGAGGGDDHHVIRLQGAGWLICHGYACSFLKTAYRPVGMA